MTRYEELRDLALRDALCSNSYNLVKFQMTNGFHPSKVGWFANNLLLDALCRKDRSTAIKNKELECEILSMYLEEDCRYIYGDRRLRLVDFSIYMGFIKIVDTLIPRYVMPTDTHIDNLCFRAKVTGYSYSLECLVETYRVTGKNEIYEQVKEAALQGCFLDILDKLKSARAYVKLEYPDDYRTL